MQAARPGGAAAGAAGETGEGSNLSRRALLGLGFLRMVPDGLVGGPAAVPAAARSRADDNAVLKARARAAWSLGAYREFGRALEPAAEAVAGAAGAGAGTQLLDVGAGDGNLALAAARRGADVTACDLSPALLAQGRRRTQAAGAAVTWHEGDAEALPYEDARFDVVGSCFGALHAPRPAAVTAELFRVVRPGGVVAMANWTTSGFMGRLLSLTGDHLGHPRSLRPAQWGRYETVYREFFVFTDDFDCTRRSLRFEADSAAALLAWLCAQPGELAFGLPTLAAPERAELEEALADLISSYGQTAAGARWAVDAEYELVLARRPE